MSLSWSRRSCASSRPHAVEPTSTAHSARAATRARSLPSAVRSSRSTAIEARSPRARISPAQAGGRLTLVEGRFSDLDAIAREHGHETVDGVVLDIGVSSMQLDQAERGFSFRNDGPLDMRMGGDGPTRGRCRQHARSRPISPGSSRCSAKRKRRARSPRRSTVRERRGRSAARWNSPRSFRARSGGGPADTIHPATRTFQALRIFVNRELDELAEALAASERILARRRPAGRRRLPFARGPHRQALPDRALGQATARLAASAGADRRPADLRTPHPGSSRARRKRDQDQSAGTLGEAARGAPDRRAGASAWTCGASGFPTCRNSSGEGHHDQNHQSPAAPADDRRRGGHL